MSYLIKERMMRDKSNQDDSVTFGDSAVVAAVENVSATKKERGIEPPLFGAKMVKVEVVGYRNLPAVVANETLNIDELPNEILEKIFEHLIELENDDGSNRKSKLATNNQSYLNCRLVSTRWKFWMESVLEKKSISIWKAKSVPISIKNMEAEPPALGNLFVLKTENRFTPVKWAFLPPALESWEEKGNPFPSQSLKLTSHLEDRDRFHRSQKPRKRAQLIRLTDFFSKFGEHLTSLILTSVTLSPETFIGILENTPKLKALNLIRVLFRGKLANCAQLPSLQHLQHVRVLHVMIVLKKEDARDIDFPYCNDKKMKLYYWILSPFKQQLLTLDTDGQSGIGSAANFANLERLFITHVEIYHIDDPRFLQPQFFLYPRLKSLFLTHVEIRFNSTIMEWFQHHIAPFAETLVELRLDIPRESFGGFRSAGPLFQLPPKLIQKKVNDVVFRELKSLEITFPRYPEEVEVIKTLIKMFSNLEALTFLDIRYGMADPKNVVDREGYSKVCPKLKKIMMRRF